MLSPTIFSGSLPGLTDFVPSLSLATTPEADYGSFVLTGVLMTLVVIYAMSKLGENSPNESAYLLY